MCPFCSSDMHSFCSSNCECHNDDIDLLEDTELETNNRRSGRSNSISSRTGKRTSILKDQQSTGRKRAAKLYPLDITKPCEWQGLANCGGGLFPTIGCINGLQQARHHGPDKNVSNNEPGNVWRICHACHYQYHAANDSTYDWNSTSFNPANSRPQTNEDKEKAVMIYLKFMANKNKRLKD